MSLHMPKPVEFTPVPTGTHLAICYRVIDLGTQEKKFMGEARLSHLILIQWEIPDERMSDGRPFSVSKEYTFSASSRSHLRKDLESWRARAFTNEEIEGFDITTVLGQPCLITVMNTESNGRDYTKLTAIGKIPKGMAVPQAENEKLKIVLTPRDFNKNDFAKLSEKLQTRIKRSPEYQSIITGKPLILPQSHADDFDDEIPF